MVVPCPKCRQALPDALINTTALQPCPSCTTPIMVEVFPAFHVPQAQGNTGEKIILEGESSCFYHPEKRAAIACEECGRFLCGLCDMEVNGRHLCPACLQSGKRKGKLVQLENRRERYDSMAFILAIMPMVTFIGIYFTWLTGPATLYIVFRHWNSPPSLTGRSRWRFIVAGIIALLQCIVWAVAIYFIIQAIQKRGHH